MEFAILRIDPYCHELRTYLSKEVTIDEIQRQRARQGDAGKLKEKVGEAMGDSGMRDGGTAEKVGGKVQRKVGDVKKVFGK